jgi:4-hydroxybenzoate polyprenyltransferase
LKLLPAFLRLVRWPNLLFIVITQILFVYCIQHPLFLRANVTPNLTNNYLALLILSSVLIAAAGNIINDYFDLNIDQINKPDKVIVEKIISRRWVIVWHLVISTIGILIGFYIDWKTNVRFLGFTHMALVFLLFLYSISLKKKLLAGNILISLLTAWVILVIYWCELSNIHTPVLLGTFTRITFLYGGFAFVISLIREVVKDMEDVEGDERFGGHTMPIAWGFNATKVFVAVWLIVLIGALSIVQFYVLNFRWWWSAVYCILLIVLPLLYILQQLFKAASTKDYHRLSSLIKVVMLTGILSMIFFRIYL